MTSSVRFISPSQSYHRCEGIRAKLSYVTFCLPNKGVDASSYFLPVGRFPQRPLRAEQIGFFLRDWSQPQHSGDVNFCPLGKQRRFTAFEAQHTKKLHFSSTLMKIPKILPESTIKHMQETALILNHENPTFKIPK